MKTAWTEMGIKISGEYNRILGCCAGPDFPDYMKEIAGNYARGEWKSYAGVLDHADLDYRGKTILDFGCKYGFVLPLFVLSGVEKAVGVDVELSYIQPGKQLFESIYNNVTLIHVEGGLLPFESSIYDFIMINEVVSHINPSIFHLTLHELRRILKPGGVILISDGNNLDSSSVRARLPALYDAWENAPDGTKTDRDVVIRSFLNRRKDIIIARSAGLLTAARIDFLAENTSGLWGDILEKVIDGYLETGELVRRPYIHGACPENPGEPGVMMENGFYPSALALELRKYGFETEEIDVGDRKQRIAMRLARFAESAARLLREKYAGENFTLKSKHL